MALSDTAVRSAKAGDKPRKMTDGRGLFLQVMPNGSKYWRFRYRFDGKEKLLALGVYPDVSLSYARDQREQARQLLARGIDPGAPRRAGSGQSAGMPPLPTRFQSTRSMSRSSGRARCRTPSARWVGLP